MTQPASTSPSADNDRRQFHRIHYPALERPWLFIGKQAYEVLDISVSGLRYIAPQTPIPNLHDQIQGALHFRHSGRHTKTPLQIQGTVVRTQDHEIAIHFNKEIPFNVLLAEQQYLRKHYPMWS